MLITGLFFATYYLYTFKIKKEKHGKTVIYATYLWCMLHLVMAILYSIRITPISFQLVDTETFEWLRPWRGSFIYVLIILWTCIVLLGAKLTRLKTQFWVSMSLVALSNLLSVIIMLKYTHIDSAGWYLARGPSALAQWPWWSCSCLIFSSATKPHVRPMNYPMKIQSATRWPDFSTVAIL